MLTLENITVEFSNFQRSKNDDKKIFKALDGISFKLDRGDRLALIGKNGSGKSTLLKVMAGVLPPDEGRVIAEGKIFPALRPSPGLFMQASCFDNVKLQGLFYGFRGLALKKYIESVVEFAELGDFLFTPVELLSAGMRGRLHVATLSNVNPEILIMDEWIGVSDEKVLRKNDSLLKSLVSTSEVFVLASHRKRLVNDFCNKAAVFDSGKLMFLGDVGEALELKDGLDS